MMVTRFNDHWDMQSNTKIPPFADLVHGPIYPFPNIALTKWERNPKVGQRIEKLRKMYFDDKHIDDWTTINRNCRAALQ